MEDKIASIAFPNTVSENEQSTYHSSRFKIKKILKAGEMGNISWFEITEINSGKKFAEIKESVCDIFFN